MKTVALAVALSLLLFLGLGNHADWRGLLGGAEGIRTSDLGGTGTHRFPFQPLRFYAAIR
jgi:hypothetical protein